MGEKPNVRVNRPDTFIEERPSTIAELVAEIPTLRRDTEGQDGHRKFKYITIDQIYHKVRPLLTARGWSIYDTAVSVDGAPWWQTVLVDSKNDDLRRIQFPMPRLATDVRDMGKQITYCRRYGVSMLLALVADEDDDGAGVSGNNAPKPAPPKSVREVLEELGSVGHLSAAQQRDLKRELIDYAKARGISAVQVGQLMVEMFERSKLADLSAAEYEQLCAEIDSRGESASGGLLS